MANKILLVHSGNETFVRLDLKFLSQIFQVQEFYVKRPFPVKFLRYQKNINENDLTFCWFASWNSFWALVLSKLFHKPSILVIGGYDTAKDYEANYGNQRGGIKKYISRWAIKLATKVISFSYFSRTEAEQNAAVPHDRVQVVYLGVPDPFRNVKQFEKEKLVLGVGNVDWTNLIRKGWEPFVRSAEFLPDFEFILVGNWADDSIKYLQSIATKNVHFTGRVSDEQLLVYYQRASYYVQASSHEGFGLSVAESMLAKCIPIVANNGSLPEVVGDCGIYLDNLEPETIAETIRKIPEGTDLGVRARQRILFHFPPEKRIVALAEIVNQTLNH